MYRRWMLLTVLSVMASTALSRTCPAAPSGLAVLIPYYVDITNPNTYGQALINHSSSCRMYAIISGSNNNGPPNAKTDGISIATYQTAFRRLNASGVGLYGYIHTLVDFNAPKPATRPLASVYADVDSWYSNFKGMLLGLFVDEVDEQAVNVNTKTYYGAIAQYIRSHHGGRVIFNPGSAVSCGLAAEADIVVDFEDTLQGWQDYTQPCACPGSSACSAIIYNTPNATVPSLLASLKSDQYKYVYLTNLAGVNPYNALPSYWTSFARQVTGV